MVILIQMQQTWFQRHTLNEGQVRRLCITLKLLYGITFSYIALHPEIIKQ